MGLLNFFKKSNDTISKQRDDIKEIFDRHCYNICKEAALKIHMKSHRNFYEGDLYENLTDEMLLQIADEKLLDECKFEAHILAFSIINYHISLKFNFDPNTGQLYTTGKLLNSVFHQIVDEGKSDSLLSMKLTKHYQEIGNSPSMVMYVFNRVVEYSREIKYIQESRNKVVNKIIIEEDIFNYDSTDFISMPYDRLNALYFNPFFDNLSDEVVNYKYNPFSDLDDGFIDAEEYIKANLIIPM